MTFQAQQEPPGSVGSFDTDGMRLASLVTAINVLVASGFSIAAIIRPQYLAPAESVPTQASLLLAMYAAAPRIPLALLALGAIHEQATPALLILGARIVI